MQNVPITLSRFTYWLIDRNRRAFLIGQSNIAQYKIRTGICDNVRSGGVKCCNQRAAIAVPPVWDLNKRDSYTIETKIDPITGLTVRFTLR